MTEASNGGPAADSAAGGESAQIKSMRAGLGRDNLSFLKALPLFAGVHEQRLAELAGRLEEQHYPRGEVIVRQGVPMQGVLFVRSGIVSVGRLSPVTQETHTFGFLKEGDLLGEVELLSSPNGLATGQATALTQVDLLALAGRDFLDLLHGESSVALALARLLAHRLRAATERIGTYGGMENRVCLLLGTGPGVGVTTIGSALAMSLAASTGEPTVYTEYPDASRLSPGFDPAAEGQPSRQPGGFDVVVPGGASDMLPEVRTTIFADQLTTAYFNIVVGLVGALDTSLAYLLERTDQVVVVTTPDEAGAGQLAALTARLKDLVRGDRTGAYVLVNRPTEEHAALPTPSYADFDLAHLPDLPAGSALTPESTPGPLTTVAATLADRLRRTNQVRMYIPTTVSVDQALDTTPYVQHALEFLGDLFGGATSDDADGVWKSDQAGLVGETVYIVTSYTTRADLDRHLPGIVDYVERLKLELKQEAMALEVNEKLMLI